MPLYAEQVTAYTSTWPQNNQEVYNKLVSKYGQPHEATATHLTWYNNGPWKKTVLNKQAGNTMLEQTAYAEVPPEKLSEIALFNKGIQVDQTNNEITARSNREENNFLTLNLAKEIIDGNMSATEARRQAAQVKDVMSKSQYMKSLNFTQGPTPASNSSHQ